MKKRKLSQDQVTLLEQLQFGFKSAGHGTSARSSRLRATHEEAVVEKCRLEAELMRLKDRLSESEEEIQRLAASLGTSAGASGDILMISFISMDFPDRMQFPGDYTFDDIPFVPDWNRAAGMGKWIDEYVTLDIFARTS
ncbi:hypothetical protein MLD38_004651 [Melastoma candidum]|uniref:Uncharacterized protein n=1 Tax=Melastoma candidum TaxID=119954 RepID=A0ACB9S6G2_9MYRT|nr:hypothetical protein MLD38_004651 [Melastoma candidum]